MFVSHTHVHIPGCSVHPLSDWLCSCLTCINYWVEYASFDWLWGLCLTCKSKTKYWVKHASFVTGYVCASHVQLTGLCLTGYEVCVSHVQITGWSMLPLSHCLEVCVSHVQITGLEVCVSHVQITGWSVHHLSDWEKKPKHCRKSPSENCTSTFQVPTS